MRIRRSALAAALVSAVLMAGCTVALMSSYDETTDRGITALANHLEALLQELDQDPVPPYSSVKKTYDGIRADLRSLHFRNEARPNNEITVRQLDALAAQLDTFERQHRESALVRAMVAPARDSFEQTCRAILKLELAKKESNKKS